MNQSTNTTETAIELALKRWREKRVVPSNEPVEKMAIAISREAGTPALGIAQLVGAQLQWPVYDRELVEMIIQDSEVNAVLVESVDERNVSWLTECIEAFVGAPTMSGAKYVHRLAKVLVSLAAHGQCVIVGRGAGQLLPPERVFSVRLTAPLKHRIEQFRKKENVSREEATKRVRQIDNQRTNFVKEHFHKDPREPQWFDLVLNTARFDEAACAELIVAAYAKRMAVNDQSKTAM